MKHTRDAKDDAPTIVVKVGGFLGLGGRLVAIPGGKWVQSRGTIVLGMTAADIAKLPTWEPRPSGEFVGKK